MFSLPDVANFAFADPGYLLLLAVPGLLAALWLWRLYRHRIERRRFARDRVLPVRERLGQAGDLPFWLSLLLACTLCILALARPQARVKVDQRAGADLIILLDASASMYVNDVLPSRWQRSQQFLRTLAESLSWKGDRVALALFASRTSPQLRLTKDPNALFFFFDQLGERSPFPLESDATWDTNLEEAIAWGVKLIDADEALFGRSNNAKAFVLVTDGQAWSGEVRRALEAARQRRVVLHVVGIGTITGGMIPEPVGDDGLESPAKRRSVLDERGLRELARNGGGDYLEIGRGADRDLAFRLISTVRQRATVRDEVTSHEDLYWHFLVGAAACLAVAAVLLRRRTELWWHAGGTLAALGVLIAVIP